MCKCLARGGVGGEWMRGLSMCACVVCVVMWYVCEMCGLLFVLDVCMLRECEGAKVKQCSILLHLIDICFLPCICL